MKTYKILKDNWATFQNFNSLEEAEIWALEKLGQGCTVIISDEQILPITAEQKLQLDLEFGKQLIKDFLTDNRLITPAVSPTESLELLNKFQNIEKLASLGDIKSVSILLNGIAVDNRLFTQERKDKYLTMISNYLNT